MSAEAADSPASDPEEGCSQQAPPSYPLRSKGAKSKSTPATKSTQRKRTRDSSPECEPPVTSKCPPDRGRRCRRTKRATYCISSDEDSSADQQHCSSDEDLSADQQHCSSDEELSADQQHCSLDDDTHEKPSGQDSVHAQSGRNDPSGFKSHSEAEKQNGDHRSDSNPDADYLHREDQPWGMEHFNNGLSQDFPGTYESSKMMVVFYSAFVTCSHRNPLH